MHSSNADAPSRRDAPALPVTAVCGGQDASTASTGGATMSGLSLIVDLFAGGGGTSI